MTSITADYLTSIRHRLDLAGGRECSAAADEIRTFLLRNEGKWTIEEGYRILHSAWGWVSMTLDRQNHRPEQEADLLAMEGELATAVEQYRRAGSIS